MHSQEAHLNDLNSPASQRSFRLIFGVNLLWLPLSMLFNSLQSLVLPVFVLRVVDPTRKATVLGLILFFGLAAGAVVQPIVGRYSDRLTPSGNARPPLRGRRQPVVIVGVVLSLLCLFGFGKASNVLMLAVSYVALTVSAGVAQAGFQGLMPDLVPNRLHGRASGLKGLLELLGSVLGFGVVGVLVKKGQADLALVAIAALLVIGTILTLILVREGARIDKPESAVPADPRPAGPASTLARGASRARRTAPAGLQVLGDSSAFSRVLLSRFLFLLGVYGIGHFLLYYVRDRLHAHGATSTTSLLLTVFTLETAIVAVAGGMLSDRVGRLPVLWFGAGLSAVGSVVLAPASALWLIVIAGSIMSVGSGLFASANWALTADLTPPGAGGQFFGVLAIATGGAAAVAGLFGPLVDRAGYAPLFFVAAAAFALSGMALPRKEHVARAMYVLGEAPGG